MSTIKRDPYIFARATVKPADMHTVLNFLNLADECGVGPTKLYGRLQSDGLIACAATLSPLQDALTSLGRAVIGLHVEHHGRRMSLYSVSNGWLATGIAEGYLDDEGYPEPDTSVEGEGATPWEALDKCLREAIKLELEADADKEAATAPP